MRKNLEGKEIYKNYGIVIGIFLIAMMISILIFFGINGKKVRKNTEEELYSYVERPDRQWSCFSEGESLPYNFSCCSSRYFSTCSLISEYGIFAAMASSLAPAIIVSAASFVKPRLIR